MAGEWIQWEKGLDEKREVVLMASRLRRDREFVACCLMRLWCWCDSNIPEEDFHPETFDASINLGPDPFPFLDTKAGLPGIAKAMASPDVNWIRWHGGPVVFSRLGIHLGYTAKTRALGAKRAKRFRERNAKSNDPAVTPSPLCVVSVSDSSPWGGGAGGGPPPADGWLTPEQHAQANGLAVAFASSARPRKPRSFDDAFEFFGAKIRLGVDPERILAAIKVRDPTHSPSQFWIKAGLEAPPWEKPKRSEAEELRLLEAVLQDADRKQASKGRGPSGSGGPQLLNAG